MNSNNENDMYTDVTGDAGSRFAEEYFRTQIGDTEFQILKVSSDGNPIQYSVLDNQGRNCVHATIQCQTFGEGRLYLSQILYRPTCAIGKTMERGEATLHMVKSLLIMAMKDTEYDCIYFTDKSEIECILPNAYDMAFVASLGILKFITEGYTWYQKHLQAEIVHEKLKEKMDHSNRLLEEGATKEGLESVIAAIDEGLSMYRTERWNTNAKRVATTILSESQGKSWRSIFSALFSERGDLAKRLGANIGCMLLAILQMEIALMFDLPHLTSIPCRIRRETILAYPEVEYLEFVRNDNPVHTDKKRKETLMKLSYIQSAIPLYTVGGKKTLRLRRVKRIPREYGRNIFGYMSQRYHHDGKTRKLRHKKRCVVKSE